MSNSVKYTVKASWFNDAEGMLRVDLILAEYALKEERAELAAEGQA